MWVNDILIENKREAILQYKSRRTKKCVKRAIKCKAKIRNMIFLLIVIQIFFCLTIVRKRKIVFYAQKNKTKIKNYIILLRKTLKYL